MLVYWFSSRHHDEPHTQSIWTKKKPIPQRSHYIFHAFYYIFLFQFFCFFHFSLHRNIQIKIKHTLTQREISHCARFSLSNLKFLFEVTIAVENFFVLLSRYSIDWHFGFNSSFCLFAEIPLKHLHNDKRKWFMKVCWNRKNHINTYFIIFLKSLVFNSHQFFHKFIYKYKWDC